jgi:hypothetical protein
MLYNKRPIYAFLMLAFAAGFSSGCIKKDPEIPSTQVLMVPLSPNSPPVDFVLNGIRQAVTVNYSSTVGTTTYSLPYYTINAGNTELSYNLTGGNNKLAFAVSNLGADQAYSTFMIDSVGKAKLALVSDNLAEPTPGKVKIRFFHFSPNAPAVNVAFAPVIGGVTGTYANLFNNRSFNDQAAVANLQQFIEIDPGLFTFQFRLVSNGTAAYTTSSVNLLPDRIYTLAARGFVGGAGNLALGAWVYPNKAQ